MDELFNMLMKIKERPMLYMGNPTLEKFIMFMKGYIACQYEENTPEYPEIFPGFQEYIQNRYGIQSSQSWDRIIKFYSPNEKYAIEQFYKHLENFYK